MKRTFRKLRPKRYRMPLPVAVQLTYLAALHERTAYLRRLINARLIPKLPALTDVRDDSLRMDAPTKQILDQITEAFFKRYPDGKNKTLSEKIAELTGKHQEAQPLAGRVGPGRDDKKVKASFVKENVSLIKSIPQTYLEQVGEVLRKGLADGSRAEEISKSLEERFNVSESRAKLIARDQVLKLNGRLAQSRQETLGIESYVWRTLGDNRVRSDHADREGEVYRWDDPPGDPEDPATGGHPGAAINCRCYAESILPAELDEGS